MISAQVADELLTHLRAREDRGSALRRAAMERLAGLPGYDWCGVYRLEGGILVLDEYVGAETDHTKIEVGVGVCGTAVAENRNQVVEDVRGLDNYLACSLQTRSEIVVLIRRGGEILGQVDVDGHRVGAFDASDEALLEQVAGVLAQRWE
ncbi:MAG TPA: GAF domain-containing protein [Fimbriimonadaceae bacterium]|nr:GAF domain-containing protein [Fimbriimonadaceae bacterium]